MKGIGEVFGGVEKGGGGGWGWEREVGIGGGRGVFWNIFFFEKRGGGVWRGGMGVFLVGLGKWVWLNGFDGYGIGLDTPFKYLAKFDRHHIKRVGRRDDGDQGLEGIKSIGLRVAEIQAIY